MSRLIPVAVMMILAACAGSHELSDTDRAKLDPSLQRLLSGREVVEADYDVGIRQDGTKEYAVIIRSNQADEITSAGIRISSLFGEVITARVTSDELAKLVRLPSVRFVESGSKNSLH